MMLATYSISDLLLRRRCSINIFAGMLAVSLLLHLAASVIFLLPGRFSPPSAPPVFMELQNLVEAPAPIETPVAKEVTPSTQPAVPPETAPETAAETAAETAPETAKLEQSVANSLRRAVQTPEAVHESSIGLGMLSGHFASFAEGASLKDDIRVYYFSLMRRINEVWWTRGVAQASFANAAAVNLIISRDGKVIACELLQSSGNSEQDKIILDVVKAAEPLPPLPHNFRQRTFTAPIRFVPPLRLMLPGFTGKSKLGIMHGE